MHKKRRPREPRDAATAEAVWGAPRLAVITGAQQKSWYKTQQDKKGNEYAH
jgi:hypothetical protein